MTRWSRALPWIALVIVYFVWGSTYLGIRVAVETLPPYLMTGSRWLIAGSLLFALQWLFSKERRALPARPELLRAAKRRGCRTLDGLGMLVNQAAIAFQPACFRANFHHR